MHPTPSLRSYQTEPVEWLTKQKRALLVAPAGSGKTRMALTALARIRIPDSGFFGPYKDVETDPKWNLRIYIDPHEPPFVGSYGYIIDSSKYTLNKGLIIIPLHTFDTLIEYKKYRINTPIVIRNNNQFLAKTIKTIPCKYKDTLNQINAIPNL